MVQDLLKTSFILWQRSKEEAEAVQYLTYYCKDDEVVASSAVTRHEIELLCGDSGTSTSSACFRPSNWAEM